MPTKKEIIEQLYLDKRFNECINKMQPEHIRDDLRNEVILVLLDKPDAIIRILYKKKELVFYAIRIIITYATSKTSPFYKKYCSLPQVESEAEEEDIERVIREAKEERVYEILLRIKRIAYTKNPTYVKEIMPAISWYNQYVLSVYMRYKTYREAEKILDIQFESIYKTVQQTIKQLREYAANS